MLDKYEIDGTHIQNEIHLPDELSADDKEEIIINYINSSKPNLNYLRMIVNVQGTAEFSISDRTRLNARKRAEAEENVLFYKNSEFYMETTVNYSRSQEDVVKKDIKDQNLAFSYSSKWIKENKNYSTLMNNFIYLFNFVDLQMRITLVNKPCEMGVFEWHLFMRSKKEYATCMAFNRKDVLSKLQMVAYYQELT